jgi:hypothetical protein
LKWEQPRGPNPSQEEEKKRRSRLFIREDFKKEGRRVQEFSNLFFNEKLYLLGYNAE